MRPKYCGEACRKAKPQRITFFGKRSRYTRVGRHYEAVLAVESILGRPLRPGEGVHRLDGNPANCNPSNLRVFPSRADLWRYLSADLEWVRRRTMKIRAGVRQRLRSRDLQQFGAETPSVMGEKGA